MIMSGRDARGSEDNERHGVARSQQRLYVAFTQSKDEVVPD